MHPRRLIFCTVLVMVSVAVVPAAVRPHESPNMAGRSTVYAPNGAVATSQPLASSAGLKVLENGGNAVDAAVAAAAVLSVVEPMMTGIGGDMFALVWLADEEKLVGLNSSGRSGTHMTRETLLERGHEDVPSSGPLTITVPGALAGWSQLLEKYGTMSLGEVLQPAIQFAEGGFPVSPRISDFWKEREESLQKDQGARDTFLLDRAKAPSPGDWFVNADYAQTLKLISTEGSDIFYKGSLGRRIVSRIKEMGGFLETSDFQDHEAIWIQPISATYHGYTLWELPPNGQGIAALEILKILEPFDLKSMGHNSPEYLHHLIEAKKLAYADLHHFVGDPEHMEVRHSSLLTDSFIKSRRDLISVRAIPHPDPGKARTASDTTYLTTADRHGNMVSLINSVSATFGSGVVVPGTGFALQNRGSGFTMKPGMANTVAPKKRPFHTIIPAFVTVSKDGKEQPWLSYGVMGGAMQPQGHVQVLLNLVVFGMDLQEALDAARFRHLDGLKVALEPVFSQAVRDALAARGHEIVDHKGVFFGGGQAIMRLDSGWASASDPRMDGTAIGH